MSRLSRALAVTFAVVLLAPAARADEVGQLLKGGPLVRIETNAKGKLKRGTAIADVAAPADRVWATLKDFDNYRFFMPRIDELTVRRVGAEYELDFELDTPLVSTNYTNRYSLDETKRQMRVRQVAGDLKGTNFHWRVVSLGPNKTRLYYSGIVKNFSSFAQRLEDDQQTITVGINVVSLLTALRAVKNRAELMHRQSGHTTPTTTMSSGG
jgi:carbon monoxide dehydrogenase subunit G